MQDASQPELALHEEVLLLALSDEKGTVGGMYLSAITGAIVAELILSECVTLEGEKQLVTAVPRKRIDDPVLRECRDKLRDAKRRRPVAHWVASLATVRGLVDRIAQRLADRGILRVDEDRVLWVFKRRIYPEQDPKPERRLRDRLRRAVFTDTRNVDARTVVLLSIAHRTLLLPMNFDKKKLRARKKRIDQVIKGEVSGKAVGDAIASAQAMQAAVVSAVIMPAVIIPTITS